MAVDLLDASLCADKPAYSMGVALVAEKLPASGSIPLPNLEGGFLAACGRGTPPSPTDLRRPGEGLLLAAPTAVTGRCR